MHIGMNKIAKKRIQNDSHLLWDHFSTTTTKPQKLNQCIFFAVCMTSTLAHTNSLSLVHSHILPFSMFNYLINIINPGRNLPPKRRKAFNMIKFLLRPFSTMTIHKCVIAYIKKTRPSLKLYIPAPSFMQIPAAI
jgi:hypothetical protein